MDDSSRAVQHEARIQELSQEVFTLRHLLAAYDTLVLDHTAAAHRHTADLEAQLDARDVVISALHAGAAGASSGLDVIAHSTLCRIAAPLRASDDIHNSPPLPDGAALDACLALLQDPATWHAIAAGTPTHAEMVVECAVQTSGGKPRQPVARATQTEGSPSPSPLDRQVSATEAELCAVTNELAAVLEAYAALQAQTADDKAALERVLADATNELNVCHATIAALEAALGVTPPQP